MEMVSVPLFKPGVYGFTTVLFKPSKTGIRNLSRVLGLDVQIQCQMPGYRYTFMDSDGRTLFVGNTSESANYLRGVACGQVAMHRLWLVGGSK
jgi:hypothetical protein